MSSTRPRYLSRTLLSPADHPLRDRKARDTKGILFFLRQSYMPGRNCDSQIILRFGNTIAKNHEIRVNVFFIINLFLNLSSNNAHNSLSSNPFSCSISSIYFVDKFQCELSSDISHFNKTIDSTWEMSNDYCKKKAALPLGCFVHLPQKFPVLEDNTRCTSSRFFLRFLWPVKRNVGNVIRISTLEEKERCHYFMSSILWNDLCKNVYARDSIKLNYFCCLISIQRPRKSYQDLRGSYDDRLSHSKNSIKYFQVKNLEELLQSFL